jgi:hypothetical protein
MHGLILRSYIILIKIYYFQQVAYPQYFCVPPPYGYALPPTGGPPRVVPAMSRGPNVPNESYYGFKPGRECKFCKNNGESVELYRR